MPIWAGPVREGTTTLARRPFTRQKLLRLSTLDGQGRTCETLQCLHGRRHRSFTFRHLHRIGARRQHVAKRHPLQDTAPPIHFIRIVHMNAHQSKPGILQTQIDVYRLEQLIKSSQTLINHLSGYAVSASNFDDEAFADILGAQMAILDANRILGARESPQGCH
jgi:hypothetical protein